MAGHDCESPFTAGSMLVTCECLFVLLVWMTSARPSWLPLRAVHYALAAVVTVQYSLSPIFSNPPVGNGAGLTMSWILATFVVAFNKFFELGFILTRPRVGGAMDETDDVKPLMSEFWPVLILPVAFCSQSTNFSLSGGN